MGVPTEGQCVGTTKIQSCFVSEEGNTPPTIVMSTCGAQQACQVVNGSAVCKPTGACFEGATRLQGLANNARVPEGRLGRDGLWRRQLLRRRADQRTGSGAPVHRASGGSLKPAAAAARPASAVPPPPVGRPGGAVIKH